MTEHPLPPPPAGPPVPPPVPPWRNPAAVGIALTVAIGWSIVMIGIGNAMSASSTTTTPTTPAKAVETYLAPPTTRAMTTSTAPPTTAIPTTTAPKGLRDGTFIVGTDVEPGTYRGSSTGRCYWARLRNFTGRGDILANDYVSAPGAVIVTIDASDAGFKSSDCGRWERIG